MVSASVTGSNAERDSPSPDFGRITDGWSARSFDSSARLPILACSRAAVACYVFRNGFGSELDAYGRAWRCAGDVAATSATVESGFEDGRWARRLVRADGTSGSGSEHPARTASCAVESDAVCDTEYCCSEPESAAVFSTTVARSGSSAACNESDRAIWPISTSNVDSTVAKPSTGLGLKCCSASATHGDSRSHSDCAPSVVSDPSSESESTPTTTSNPTPIAKVSPTTITPVHTRTTHPYEPATADSDSYCSRDDNDAVTFFRRVTTGTFGATTGSSDVDAGPIYDG